MWIWCLDKIDGQFNRGKYDTPRYTTDFEWYLIFKQTCHCMRSKNDVILCTFTWFVHSSTITFHHIPLKLTIWIPAECSVCDFSERRHWKLPLWQSVIFFNGAKEKAGFYTFLLQTNPCSSGGYIGIATWIYLKTTETFAVALCAEPLVHKRLNFNQVTTERCRFLCHNLL